MIGPTAQGHPRSGCARPVALGRGAERGRYADGSPDCYHAAVVAIPMFDVDAYSKPDCTSGRFGLADHARLLGFFIEDIPESGPNKDDVIGYFVPFRGIYSRKDRPRSPRRS